MSKKHKIIIHLLGFCGGLYCLIGLIFHLKDMFSKSKFNHTFLVIGLASLVTFFIYKYLDYLKFLWLLITKKEKKDE